MSRNWIIEVLCDLHGFASANGLPLLADQLEEAQVVALAELAQDAPRNAEPDGTQAGRPSGAAR
jgi:hypothetical protein